MTAGFDDSTRRGPIRRAGLLAAGWILPLALLGSCSSSESAADEAATTETTACDGRRIGVLVDRRHHG